MQAAAGTCPLVLMRYCAETASVAEAQCRRAHLPAMGGDQIASMAAYAAPEQLIRVWATRVAGTADRRPILPK